MNIRELKAVLLAQPGRIVRLLLPGGDPVPAAFHVTEVGHVVKRFIDCGGTIRVQETCQLQAWVGEDDPGHRLTAGKLAGILDRSRPVVPSEALEVEVEYDDGVVAQYRLAGGTVAGDALEFALVNKTTDCLAREACGLEPAGCGCGPAGGGQCC